MDRLGRQAGQRVPLLVLTFVVIGFGVLAVSGAVATSVQEDTDPEAEFVVEPVMPDPGEEVPFDASDSEPGDGNIVEYRWDFTDDGQFDKTTTEPETTWTYDESYSKETVNVTLEVEDSQGGVDEHSLWVRVVPTQWEWDYWHSFTAPTVADGTVYVDSDQDFSAVDAETGEVEWQVEDDQLGDSPAVAEGTVFMAGYHYVEEENALESSVFALDAGTGEEEWRYEMNGSSSRTSLTVVDGTVYVEDYHHGDEHSNVYALDADPEWDVGSYEAGDEHWRFQIDERVHTSVTVGDGHVYVGTDGGIFALDADPGWQGGTSAAGDERWRFESDEPIFSSPTVVDGTVYVGGMDETVYALDGFTGVPRWTFDAGTSVVSSPTVADGTVYVGTIGGDLYALDANPGWAGGSHEQEDEIWRFETNDEIGTSPTVAHGTVYFANGAVMGTWPIPEETAMFAVDTYTGEEEWSFDVFGRPADPIVADGKLYFNARQSLYAVNESVSGWSDGSRVELGTLNHNDYEPPITLEIDEPNSTRHVEGGEPVEVSVDVRNNENWSQTEELTLAIDELGADSRTVELDPQETVQHTLNISTSSDSVSADPFRATVSTTNQTTSTDITVTVSMESTDVLGDVTGDGEVGLSDAILVQEHVAGVTDLDEQAYQAAMADMTRDGHITLTDAILLVERAANLHNHSHIAVSNVTAPATVHRGEDLEVTAALENEGPSGAIQPVDVAIVDGEKEVASAERTVDMAAPGVTSPVDLGSWAEVTHTVNTTGIEVGEYDLVVSTLADSERQDILVSDDSVTTLNVSEDQPAGVIAGENVTATLEAIQIDTLSVTMVGEYNETDATLFVDGAELAFDTDRQFDGFSGDLPITVQTAPDSAGAFTLQYTATGPGGDQIAVSGPTGIKDTVEVGLVGDDDLDLLEAGIEPRLPDRYAFSNVSSVEDVGDYDILVVQTLSDFDSEAFVAATNGTDVGVIYLDQYSDVAEGIPHYETVADDVTATHEDHSSFAGDIEGPVQYTATADHEILSHITVGETVTIHDHGNDLTTWFESENFEVIGNVSDANGDIGSGIAVQEDSGTVLLSSMGYDPNLASENFTEDAETVLGNAVEYLAYELDTHGADGQFDVEVAGTNSPVVVGEDLAVDLEVENTGDEPGNQTVQLFIDDIGSDATTVSLESGESTTVHLSVQTAVDDAGSHAAVVTSENDAETVAVNVSEGEADLGVSAYFLDPDPAEEDLVIGETLNAEAVVANHGNATGALEVDFIVDDDAVDTETVAVDADSTEIVDLEHELREIGTKIVSVNGVDPVQISVSGPEFAVEAVETNSPVDEGNALEFNVTVDNVGTELGTQVITVDIDDLGNSSTELSLDDGESRTETLTVSTEAGDAGTYEATVSSENDADTVAVNVSEGEADLQVSAYFLDPDPAEEDLVVGETLHAEAVVANHGTIAGEIDVEFIVDDAVVDNDTIEVDAGTTEIVDLEHELRETGTKIVSVNGVDPVQIVVEPAPADLELESVTVPERLERGLQLEIEAEITNTGGEAGEGTISVAIASLETEKTVSVDPNATTTLTLSLPAAETLGLALTNHTVTVDGPETQETHGLTVEPRRTYPLSIPNDGDTHAFGVPAPVNGTLADILGNQSVAGSIYAYDGGWERVTDLETVEPTVGDAYVLATAGDGSTVDLELQLELGTTSNTSIDPGWRLHPATTYGNASNSFGDGLVALQSYEIPTPHGLPQGDSFGNYVVGSESWGAADPTVSPFAGYFVYYDEPATLESAVETKPLVELGYLEG